MGRDGPEPFCPLPSAEGGGGALGGERARASKPTARSRWPRVTVGGRPPGSRDAGSAWSALWVAAESAEVGPVLGLRAGVRAGWQSGQRLWRAFCACSGWGAGLCLPPQRPPESTSEEKEPHSQETREASQDSRRPRPPLPCPCRHLTRPGVYCLSGTRAVQGEGPRHFHLLCHRCHLEPGHGEAPRRLVHGADATGVRHVLPTSRCSSGAGVLGAPSRR